MQSEHAAAAKSLQLCPTLCNPVDGSPPGSLISGILQARTLDWVAISFSNAGKWKVKVKILSCVWLLVTPWTAAHEAPPSMGFSRQEYWSGLPLLPLFFVYDIFFLLEKKIVFKFLAVHFWLPNSEREVLESSWDVLVNRSTQRIFFWSVNKSDIFDAYLSLNFRD